MPETNEVPAPGQTKIVCCIIFQKSEQDPASDSNRSSFQKNPEKTTFLVKSYVIRYLQAEVGAGSGGEIFKVRFGAETNSFGSATLLERILNFNAIFFGQRSMFLLSTDT